MIESENITNKLVTLSELENDWDEIIHENILSVDTPIPVVLEKDDDELELIEKPLDQFRTHANESCLISNVQSDVNDYLSIAPGEGPPPPPPPTQCGNLYFLMSTAKN